MAISGAIFAKALVLCHNVVYRVIGPQQLVNRELFRRGLGNCGEEGRYVIDRLNNSKSGFPSLKLELFAIPRPVCDGGRDWRGRDVVPFMLISSSLYPRCIQLLTCVSRCHCSSIKMDMFLLPSLKRLKRHFHLYLHHIYPYLYLCTYTCTCPVKECQLTRKYIADYYLMIRTSWTKKLENNIAFLHSHHLEFQIEYLSFM